MKTKSAAKKTKKPVTPPPARIEVKSEDIGTFTWDLPEPLASEFRELPKRMQDQIKTVGARRLTHIIMILYALYVHPDLETTVGPKIDKSLSFFCEDLAERIKRPSKIH